MEMQGYKVSYVKINPNGSLDMKDLENLINKETFSVKPFISGSISRLSFLYSNPIPFGE